MIGSRRPPTVCDAGPRCGSLQRLARDPDPSCQKPQSTAACDPISRPCLDWRRTRRQSRPRREASPGERWPGSVMRSSACSCRPVWIRRRLSAGWRGTGRLPWPCSRAWCAMAGWACRCARTWLPPHSSGTTGAHKRIPVREDVLLPSLRSGEQKAEGGGEEPMRLKTSPALLFKPFSHAGGLFGLMLALFQARPMVLFERFVAEDWADAIRRYRPKSASLVPTMIKMIMEAGIPPEALKSLRAIRSGTAPLDPQLQIDFEQRYGVPILVDYGAAEFIGGVG